MEHTEHQTAADANNLLKEARMGCLFNASDTFLVHLEAGLHKWAEVVRDELNRRIEAEQDKARRLNGR